MSDVNANIDINIDASQALSEIKRLQREISLFNTSVNKGNAAAATALQNYQRGLLNAINATGNFNAQIKTIQTTSESFTTALEKNKLSMGQYFRYAGGATKTFGRMFKTEMDVIQKTAIERVKTLQTQYIKLGRDANGAMKAMAVRPATLDMKNFTTQSMIAAQRQQIFNQLIKQGTTNLINFGKNTQWAGRQLMVGFTVPLMYMGSVAAKEFMAMEQAAVKFRRVYGSMFTDAGETDKALDDIRKLANEFVKYGVAVVDTMEMASKAAAMGKQGAELTAQVAEATRLAVLGAVEQEQALDTTISLTNAFGTAAADLRKEIDFLNAVENQTVVAIEDLTIAIPKAGPVVKQLGGDVKDLAFFLTAMKEGGINASEGANALKSGLASLINPTDKASEFLGKLGININQIVEGNAGNLKQTVIDFAFALDQLDPLNRARAIEQLFGKFQFARLSTLFQNVIKDGSQASQVLDLTTKSVEELAILSERELGAIEDSVGTKFTAAVETLKKSIVPLGEQFLKLLTPVVEFFSGLLEKFNNLSDGTKNIITGIIAVVGGIGPVFVMLLGLVMNGVGTIIKFFNTLRMGYQRLTGQSKSIAQSTNYLTQEQLEAEAVAASLNQGHARLVQTFTAEKQAIEQLIGAYNRAAQSARNFAAANPGAMLPNARFPIRRNLGGTVPGTGNQDTVPAMLTPGEFVINKKATQNNFGLLKAINEQGDAQKFAVGGMVVPPMTAPPTQKMAIGGMVGSQLSSGKSQKILASGMATGFNGGAPVTTTTQTQTYGGLGNQVIVGDKIFYAASAKGAKTLQAMVDGLIANNVRTVESIQKSLTSMFERGAAMTASKLSSQMSLNKASNGSQALKKLLDDAVKANPYFAKEEEWLRKKYGKELTAKQLKSYLMMNKSHIDPTRTFDEMGKKTWSPLNLAADRGIVNNYLNGISMGGGSGGSKLLQHLIMDASDERFAKAMQIPNNPANVAKLRKELAYIYQGYHPVTQTQAMALRKFAEFETSNASSEYRKEFRIRGGARTTLTPRIVADLLTNRLASDFYKSPSVLRLSNYTGMTTREMIAKEKLPLRKISNEARRVRDFVNLKLQRAIIQERLMLQGVDKNTAKTVADASRKNSSSVKSFFSFRRFNVGGSVPGTGNTDKVPALLTPGEFVINKEATENNRGLLEQINAKGKVQRFAKGGIAKIAQRLYQGGPVRDPGWAFEKIDGGKRRRFEAMNQTNQRLYGGRNPTLENMTKEEMQNLRTMRRLRQSQEKAIKVQQAKTRSETQSTQVTKTNTKEVDNSTKQTKDTNKGLGAMSGKLATASGAMMGIGFAASMFGDSLGSAGEVVTKVAFGLSALLGVLPLLANPYVATVAVMAAVAGGLWFLDKKVKDLAGATSEFVDATSATTEKMKQVGELTGKVGASEIMQRRNQTMGSSQYTTDYDRAGQQFGTTFMESEVGKNIFESFKQDLEKNGPIAMQKMGVQLASYISDGVLTTEQAASFARSIGLEMGNMSVATQIVGDLISIIGPNGEDLVKDPLMVRMKIIETQKTTGDMFTSDLSAAAREAQRVFDEQGTGLRDSLGMFANNPMLAPMVTVSEYFSKGLYQLGLYGTEEKDRLNELGAAGAAYAVQTIELIQAQRDAQNKMYEDKIKELEAQKNLTNNKKEQARIDEQIAELQGRQASDDQKLAQQKEDAIKRQLDFYEQIKKQGATSITGVNETQVAFIESLNKQIEKKYKGTGQEVFTGSFIQRATDTESEALEVRIKTLVGAGDLQPEAATNLLNLFQGEEGELETLLSTEIALKNPGKYNQLLNLIGQMFDPNETAGQNLLVNITKGPDFDKKVDVLQQLSLMDGKEIDVSAYLSVDGDAKLAELIKLYDKIENLKSEDLKKAGLKVVNESEGFGPGGVDLKGMIDDWEFWGKLNDEETKTAIQTYIAIYKTIGDEDIDAEIARRQKAAGPSTIREAERGVKAPAASTYDRDTIKNELANQLAKDQYAAQQLMNTLTGGTKTDGGTRGGRSTDILDDLLNRLKMVRDATLNASMSWSDLMKLVAKPGKIKIFDGMQQELMKKGLSEDFINSMLSLEPKERKKFVNFNKKTGAAKLTKKGRTARRAIDEIVAGDFDVAQKRITTDIDNQEKALKRLVASGLDAGTAYGVIEDKALAAAIAGKQLTDKEIKSIIKSLQNANKELDLYKARMEIAARAQSLLERAKLPSIVASAELKLGRKLTQDEIKSIIDSEALQDLIGSDAVNQEELKAAIEQAGREAEVELQIKLLTEEGVIDTAEAGSNLANQIFGMYNQIAQSDIDLSTVVLPEADMGNLPILQDMQGLYQAIEARTEQIAANNLRIAGIQETINERQAVLNSMQDKLRAMQDAVEINFTRPIEAYQDQINQLQRDIEMQFTRPTEELQEKIDDLTRMQELQFGRPIQTLQEESNRLSNDLTLLDNAANKINEKYDKQAEALNKVAEINKELIAQEKSKISLADALTKGDIAAAAQAAQDMRAQAAEYAQGQQSGLLDSARQAELGSLRSASGMTREQIEERQFAIGQEIYNLEQQSLEIDKQKQVLQDQIYNLQEQSEAKQKEILAIEDKIYVLEQARKIELDKIRDLEDEIKNYQETMIDPLQKQIEAINNENSALQYQNDLAQTQLDKLNEQLTVLGKTPQAWKDIAAEILLAQINSQAFLDTLNAALTALEKIKNGEVVTETPTEPPVEPPVNPGGRVLHTYDPSKYAVVPWDTANVTTAKLWKDENGRLWDAETGGNDITGTNPPYYRMGGKVKRMALGGKVSIMPYMPNGTDTVPAMLSPGEFVMRKQIVDKLGAPFFKDLNSGNLRSPISKIMPPYQPPRFDDMQPRYRSAVMPKDISGANNFKTVYNSYSVNVNAGNGNANDIAKAVIRQIRDINNQQLRGHKA